MDLKPVTLNLKSMGKRITCYIEIPKDLDVGDIDVSTVVLNETVPVSLLDAPAPEPVPTEIGDYDSDGIPDLMMEVRQNFHHQWLGAIDHAEARGKSHPATLTITGKVAGTPFTGSDIINVLRK